MAETTEQKTVLTIDTSGSVKSVKDLKQQIKDLKDRIVELTAAGEDCSEEYTQLGTSMRQLKDINEEAMRSSKDLGDQLAVVSGSMKGVAGAISTVTGVMGLMGMESEKGTKLLKTMASAMAITTGIQAMESGYKAVKNLASGFIVAAKGAKTLGGAIKAAFMSNPIGLLITAVTTAISLFSILSSKAKEAAENIKATGEALAANINQLIGSLVNGAERSIGTFLERNDLSFRKYTDQLHEQSKQFLTILAKEYEDSSEDAYNYIVNAITGISKKTKPTIEELIGEAQTWERALGSTIETTSKQGIEYSQDVLDHMKKAQDATAKVLEQQIGVNRYQFEMLNMALEQFKGTDKEYSQILEKLTQLNSEYESLVSKYVTITDQVSNYEKGLANYNKQQRTERQNAAKQALKDAQENAKKLLENEKKAIEDWYKLRQEQNERTLEMNRDRYTKMLRDGEIGQEEYNAKMLEFENAYYTSSEKYLNQYIEKMKALQEEMRKNKYLSKEDVDAIYTALDNVENLRKLDEFRREIADNNYEYMMQQREQSAAKQELEDTIEIQNRINEIEQESFDKRLAIQKQYADDSHLISKNRYQMELELLAEEREHEMELYQAFKDENDMRMSLLYDNYANQLISEQEFNEGKNELNQEMFERELEHSKKLVEIKQNEVEQKKAIEGLYEEFERSIAGSLSTILNGLADTLGEENESYKGLKIAAALIDTLQGSIAAYTGMVQTIPGVPGIVAGVAAAAGVIASGMATIKQIQKVDAKNGTTSTSQIATQQFTTPQTATIATGATNDYTDIMGNAIGDNIQTAQQSQRVYVVYSDIEQAGGRRTQVVNSNTF